LDWKSDSFSYRIHLHSHSKVATLPWGAGRVAVPSSDGVMFIPCQPYVPLGTLRAALAYPSPDTAYTDEQLVAALQCVGLNGLCSSLDRIERWDRELTDEEQQCLVFTRLLLHKPRWVVIDEALGALDEDARKRVISLFRDGLRDTAIINIGRPQAKNHFFMRVLHLVKDPHGRCFRRDFNINLDGQPSAALANRPVNALG
jgi:vitamin B12/bleomycin/antimicrobial peptide transport system ATP-binding/permease protein